MTKTVTVSGNKTLGEGDDGTVQCVDAAATITFPHEDTWKFKKEDEFEIVSNTGSATNIAGELGVTLTTSPTIAKGTGKKAKYQGNNVYLVWSIIIVMIIIYTSNYTTKLIENDIILISNEED